MALVLTWLVLPGCAALDERYDAVRGGCELVPTVRVIWDGEGVRMDATPDVLCA